MITLLVIFLMATGKEQSPGASLIYPVTCFFDLLLCIMVVMLIGKGG